MVRAHHEGEHLRGKALSDRFRRSKYEAFLVVYEWEPDVYPHIHLRPTCEDVVAAREGTLPSSRLIDGEHPQLRWERIAERAGITQVEARQLYDRARGPGAASRSWTGRGRHFPEMD